MGTVIYFDTWKHTFCTLHHLHVMVFRFFWSFIWDTPEGTVMIYVCLLPLYQFINVTIEKLQYYVSFIMIAGITALCMSLNLIKYSLHFKENIKRNIWFAHKVHWSIISCAYCLCYILLRILDFIVTLTLLWKYCFSS